MNRWFALVAIVVLLVLLAAGGGGVGPSEIAQRYGHPAGAYSRADFEVSDDAAVMVLSVRQGTRSLRVWGDGRAEIVAGEEDERETFTRRIERSRLLSVIRSAVDHGLAEYDPDVIVHEMQGRPRDTRSLGGPPCPKGSERIEITLRFVSYSRDSFTRPRVERAGFCAPEIYSHIAQAQAFADLSALLADELATARRDGSIEILEGPPYSEATFTLSADPDRVVLKFKRLYGWDYRRSMSLFGDGRLELEHRERGRNATPKIFERNLSYAEMLELVRLAVDHGLAEWDNEVLNPVFGIGRGAVDATGPSGSIHLETYRRGDYVRNDLSRSFRSVDIGMAREFSSHVLQVQGLLKLQSALDQLFANVESAARRVNPAARGLERGP